MVLPWLAASASATSMYGDFVGADVDFLDVKETSTFGDPEPLFGAPTAVIGNNLLFTPTSFSASAAGAFGFDQTGSQLQATIMATGALPIQTITLQEFGDTDLSGVGTSATGTFAAMSGFATVTEVLGVPVTPIPIGFSVGDGNVLFSPSDLLFLPGDSGVTLWQGTATIDVQSVVAGATKVELAWDNDLSAFSEAGTTATIQKKVGTQIIVVVPEPTTVALLGAGLLLTALAARRRSG